MGAERHSVCVEVKQRPETVLIPSAISLPGIGLKPSGLTESMLPQWAISPVLNSSLKDVCAGWVVCLHIVCQFCLCKNPTRKKLSCLFYISSPYIGTLTPQKSQKTMAELGEYPISESQNENENEWITRTTVFDVWLSMGCRYLPDGLNYLFFVCGIRVGGYVGGYMHALAHMWRWYLSGDRVSPSILILRQSLSLTLGCMLLAIKPHDFWLALLSPLPSSLQKWWHCACAPYNQFCFVFFPHVSGDQTRVIRFAWKASDDRLPRHAWWF